MRNNYHPRLLEYSPTQPKMTDKISSWVAFWCGSWNFFILHLLWFTIWLILGISVDLLTLIVSLEAIVLMNILLMYQNRQASQDELRDEADYQTDKKAEREIGELKRMVKEIKAKLDQS